MDFISNKEPQIREMLNALGISSIDALFSAIPENLRLAAPTEDDGLSECEGMRLMESLARKNLYPRLDSFLGAGAYEHHIPALTGAVCAKSEFLTSYTPYQAETSQGMLQIIFEFQSAICALTGLDAANASVYDGASACAEALLMALRCNKERRKLLIADSLHPHYRAVIQLYLSSHDVDVQPIPYDADGALNMSAAERLLDDKTAAILVQSPNFFGVIEDLKPLFTRAGEKGILNILCANPLSFALFASPKELGAAITVGDCQPLGLPLSYGGPYAGYMSCRADLIRQLPGRLVGETVDAEGKRGFVLTLQAREQHIRREKATSNICTNQALAALATLVTILWYGKEGLPKLALSNYRGAAYLKSKLKEINGISLMGDASTFNEFVVRFDTPLDAVMAHFRSQGIEPGLDLGRYFPSLHNHLLVAVTETKTRYSLDHYCVVAEQCAKGALHV